MTIDRLKMLAKRAALIGSFVLLLVAGFLAWAWQQRDDVENVPLPGWPTRDRAPDSVTVTWLGVTTLLFDDGDTQILIDGFMSRPTLADLLLSRPIESSAADVNRAINRFRMDRVAAIVPSHTHFDHALDTAAIAARTGAVIFGSPSAAELARGAGVPEDQISIVTDTATREFGQFSVTLIETPHIPFGWRGSVPFDGSIESPIIGPAPASAWRVGKNFTIVIVHPQGTTLVQTSAGFTDGALADVDADVVMMGTGMLEGLGRQYAEAYWLNMVTSTGAHTVIPMHFDDYTQPFGEVRLFPRFVDDFGKTVGWLKQFQSYWDNDVSLYLPGFGETFVLYEREAPEA
ncbi:MAG: MBL fold metallo-hydrolase [Woeseiaceae bacterium]|nr:MBL fold metallo-hydrolase [Woeseiaceae bacterium]